MVGTGAVGGMAMARAYIVNEDDPVVVKIRIQDPDEEYRRFLSAKKTAADNLTDIMEDAAEKLGKENADILDYQLLILEDADFIRKVREIIYDEHLNSEYAVDAAARDFIDRFEDMGNGYLKERAADIRDIARRLNFALRGIESTILSGIHKEAIVAAEDLSPSQTMGINRNKVKGIVLERGGVSSHSVILARSMDIPCIIGVKDLMKNIVQGETVLIDGDTGEVVKNPEQERIEKYQAWLLEGIKEKQLLERYKTCRSLTRDGFQVKVYANITSGDDIAYLIDNGGEGAGLFRTEFLYMEHNTPPSEDLQYEIYSRAAGMLDGRPLIIRTLDAGGDKKIPYLDIPEEDNPFLGYRAIRYCLEHPDIFKAQISAVLRAGVHGNVGFMLPMIATLDEVRRVKALTDEVKDELSRKEIPHADNVRMGIMVETPAAALSAEALAKEVDFFSIGANDLTQYLFAADRLNQRVAALNSSFQPVLLNTIKHICDCGHRNGIEVDICGQAGEIPELIPLWVAMGIDNLSVSIPSIPKVRKQICETARSEAMEIMEKALSMDTAGEVENFLKQQFGDRGVRL